MNYSAIISPWPKKIVLYHEKAITRNCSEKKILLAGKSVDKSSKNSCTAAAASIRSPPIPSRPVDLDDTTTIVEASVNF